MIIAIPSYKRPQCISVNALKKAGFNIKDVVVGVQTEEDYKAYKEIHGDTAGHDPGADHRFLRFCRRNKKYRSLCQSIPLMILSIEIQEDIVLLC